MNCSTRYSRVSLSVETDAFASVAICQLHDAKKYDGCLCYICSSQLLCFILLIFICCSGQANFLDSRNHRSFGQLANCSVVLQLSNAAQKLANRRARSDHVSFKHHPYPPPVVGFTLQTDRPLFICCINVTCWTG